MYLMNVLYLCNFISKWVEVLRCMVVFHTDLHQLAIQTFRLLISVNSKRKEDRSKSMEGALTYVGRERWFSSS